MKSRLPQGYNNSNSGMMKRFQEIQQQIQAKSEEIENMTFSAQAGGGAVEAKVNGKKIVEDLKIQPDVLDGDDPEMLQDLVISAVNEALRKVDEVTEQEMGNITGGFPIPGLG